MLRAVLRRQRFLGLLLCLFTFMAAIDRVPDPPVVKPHRDKAAVCLTAAHHISDHNCQPEQVQFSSSSQTRWSVVRYWLFQSKPQLPVAPDLTQASDSSPPSTL